MLLTLIFKMNIDVKHSIQYTERFCKERMPMLLGCPSNEGRSTALEGVSIIREGLLSRFRANLRVNFFTAIVAQRARVTLSG